MDSPEAFYDQLADDYHLIYADWRQAVVRQGEELDRLIRANADAPLPRTVLDCTFGIGTQAIGLALRGYEVHGTDVSAKAIARARSEAASFGVAVTFGVADVRELSRQIPGTFDVVLSCDNSLPHLLRDDELRHAAQNMHAKAVQGGLLVIGLRDDDQLVRERPGATMPRLLDGPDGRRIVFQIWDWADDGRSYELHHFLLKGQQGRWRTSHSATRYRALLRDELADILRAAGFVDITTHLPAATGHHQPLVTARRGTVPT